MVGEITHCGATFDSAKSYDEAQRDLPRCVILCGGAALFAMALSVGFVFMIAAASMMPMPIGPAVGAALFVFAALLWSATAALTWWLCVIKWCRGNPYMPRSI